MEDIPKEAPAESSRQSKSSRPSFWPLFFKATLLSLVFTLIFLAITAAGVGVYLYRQAHVFSQEAGVSLTDLRATFQEGWSKTPSQTDGKKVFLILGTDSLETRGDAPPLTDTMILMSLDLESGSINTLSLPRDLWSDDYQTKINALLAYGPDHTPDNPQQFVTDTISEMTGVPIHHTVIIGMDSVAEMIDLVGGIEIDVQAGFTDETFPNPDADPSETDLDILYKTVSFAPGLQTMDGERALEYIRSRTSGDDQGTDIARNLRQQEVINGLVGKMTSQSTLKDIPLMGKLYRYYLDTFAEALAPEELIATAKTLFPSRDNLSITSHAFSTYPEDKSGVLENPPRSFQYQNQWVFVIRDQELFEASAQTFLLE